jgi:hypothetical protein
MGMKILMQNRRRSNGFNPVVPLEANFRYYCRTLFSIMCYMLKLEMVEFSSL